MLICKSALVPPKRFASQHRTLRSESTTERNPFHPGNLLEVKRSIFALLSSAILIGTISFAWHETFRAEETPKHDQRAADLTAAAQIKPFSPVNPEKGVAYLSTVTEADLVSLHMCQDSHKLFVNEPSTATADGLVDAQGAAECVVQLRSALREVPATHPAYSDIRSELAWWNGKLLELDPADYRRLNS